MEEAEERNLALGKGAVLEQGMCGDEARPPKGAVLNKPNSKCQRWRATVGEGQSSSNMTSQLTVPSAILSPPPRGPPGGEAGAFH